STAIAFSRSPCASISAARQSLKPALVRSRNSLTSLAGISMAVFGVLILFSLSFSRLSLRIFRYSKGCLQKRPAANASRRGGNFFLPRAYLARLLVRRNGRFGFGIECLRAFHEVAFLLFVPLVRAGVDVFAAFCNRLIRGGFRFAHLRLRVGVAPFNHRFGNL